MARTQPPAPAEPHSAHESVDVMGGTVNLHVVDAPEGTLARAAASLDLLEGRWSRFRADSEMSRLNTADGRPVVVSPATATLVALAVRGWHATGGAFDPTVLDAMAAAGYDRSFDLLAGRADSTTGAIAATVPGCAGIGVDVRTHTVRLPPGVRLDPDGIGKGLAADIIATQLRAAGAGGALVDVRGDIRVTGEPPEGGWRIAVDLPTAEDVTLGLSEGAAATSSLLAHQWMQAGVPQHHLIDPSTGAPATAGFVAATIVAGTAWWAEVLTKAVMLADSPASAERILSGAGAAGLVVGPDGRLQPLAGIERFLR